MFRPFLGVVLILSGLLYIAPHSSLHAATRVQNAGTSTDLSADTLIHGIEFYNAKQYSVAIEQFELAITYFQSTDNKSQAALARRYLQNAQAIVANSEEVPAAAITTTAASLDIVADVNEIASVSLGQAVDITGTVTATAEITTTAVSTGTAAISKADDLTVAPSEESAAEEEQPQASRETTPIALSPIICPTSFGSGKMAAEEEPDSAIAFVDQGEALRKEKRFDEAVAAYCSGLALVIELDDALAAANVLAKLAEAYKGAEQDAQTLVTYKNAAGLYRELDLPESAAAQLAALGRYQRSTKRFGEAVVSLESALALYQETGNVTQSAGLLSQLAESYKDAGQDGNATVAYNEAIALYYQLDKPANAAGVLEDFARYESAQERFDNAIGHLDEALALRRNLDDNKRIAGTVKQLADTHLKNGNDDQAIELYGEVVDLYTDLEDLKNAAKVVETVARHFSAAEAYDEAIDHYNEALALRQEVADNNATASTLKQLGDTYLKSDDHEQAISQYDAAIELYLEVEEAQKAVSIIEHVARAEAGAKRWEDAAARYEQALEIRRTLDDEIAVANTLSQLAKIHQQAGDESLMVAVAQEAAAVYEMAGESEKAAAAIIPTQTPTPRPTATPTPKPTTYYVSPTPPASDIFAAATVAAAATALAEVQGTATPLPQNWRVARVRVLPNLSIYDNQATAVALESIATAIAQTTGTPVNVVYWTATPRPQPTYITPTPPAPDIFAAATAAAQMTADAQVNGPPTPLPANWKVARVRVLPNLSVYDNQATAVALAQIATAIAQTTGTPEGLVYWTATPRPKPTYVTPTPPAADIFAAATAVAQMTADAQVNGPATPLPANWKVASVRVLPNLSDYANQATAVALSAFATAVAQTTGTPDGLVYWTATPRPPGGGKEPTPLFISPDQLTATPTPSVTPAVAQQLIGKILFLSDMEGGRRPDVYAMNPDGSNLIKLTSDEFYKRAIERNRSSADKRYRAINCRDACGPHGRLQIWYIDNEWNSQNQLSHFGTGGKSWDMVWSPTDAAVAFVDNQTGNDEIFVARVGEWPAKQLTDNDWEWDHHPTWSPDGNEIVFSSNREIGRRQIWIMNKDGGNKRRITDLPGEAYNPVWILYGDD